MIGIFISLIGSKTPAVNFGEVRRAQLAKSTLLTSTLGHLGSFQIFIPSKTATLVPEFAVEDLPLDRIATLVSAFAMKNLPLASTL